MVLFVRTLCSARWALGHRQRYRVKFTGGATGETGPFSWGSQGPKDAQSSLKHDLKTGYVVSLATSLGHKQVSYGFLTR